MDILLKISWEDEENSSYMKPNDSTRNAHEGSSLLPSLVSPLSLPLLAPQNLLYYTSISISPSAYRSHWTKPKFWRWQNEAHLPFVRISFGVSAPPAFAGCIGRKCQLWWPKKSVIEVCIQVAGMEKSCDKCGSHSTHCSTLNIWEEGGIKKCFPTSSLLNSNCQTVCRPNHERGCSSAGKKNMSVVCLPCLRWEAKYLTDEETWHTKSLFCSFKNTKGQWMPGYPIYLGLQFHRISHAGQGN